MVSKTLTYNFLCQTIFYSIGFITEVTETWLFSFIKVSVNVLVDWNWDLRGSDFLVTPDFFCNTGLRPNMPYSCWVTGRVLPSWCISHFKHSSYTNAFLIVVGWNININICIFSFKFQENKSTCTVLKYVSH